MKDDKIKKIYKKFKQIEEMVFELNRLFKEEILEEELYPDIKSIFDKNKGEKLRVSDITLAAWLKNGGKKKKNKIQYLLDKEYLDYFAAVRDVVYRMYSNGEVKKIEIKKQIEDEDEYFIKK